MPTLNRRGVLLGSLVTGVSLNALGASAASAATAAAPATALDAGFAHPPAQARPRAWWHWMNGNITEDGIAKDLSWMHETGIGGAHAFDAALDTPQIVDNRLIYMSDPWRRAFKRAAEIADGYGMELGIAGSPGWSESGGPWVSPEQAMKKYVWSSTTIEGGVAFKAPLRQPADDPGVFQGLSKSSPPSPFAFYRDSLVFAYPAEEDETTGLPTYTSLKQAPLDAAVLTGDDYMAGVDVDTGADAGVLMRFDNARTVRSVEFFSGAHYNLFQKGDLVPVLEASDDGAAWRHVCEVPVTQAPTTASFAAVQARFFRLRLPRAQTAETTAPRLKINRLRLSSRARVNAFETKAGFSILRDYYALDADAGPDMAGISPETVVDLSAHFHDGGLDWTPPAGTRWTVVRLGYSLTGKTNHPATPEATGLEVDKYDGAAVRQYIDAYLAKYEATTGPALIGAHGLRAVVIDSTEVGASNWTPRLIEQFHRLRGYDPSPWLPVLVGVIVGSRRRSDAFLYDFRRTLADLVVTEHYGTIAKAGREKGLFVYEESLEAGRPCLGDDLEMRRFADIPMAAMWTWGAKDPGPRLPLLADLKGAASVAHIYGQNLAAAESMTAFKEQLFRQGPAELKRVLDLEFALGINRIVIHTSPHQPRDDKKPGLTLKTYGQAFTRHETWAGMARPWVDYMARSSFLLQQGRDAADVAYFYGEEASPIALFQYAQVADAPKHNAFDYFPPDALLNQARVDNGHLVSSGGARYRALYLGGTSHRMTLPVLRKLAALAEAGLSIIGEAPVESPSLADNADEFRTLVQRLWPGKASTSVGTGRVLATSDVEAGLQALNVAPDFAFSAATGDASVLFCHRILADSDVYFLSNRRSRPERIEARFRVTGRQPELWTADSGEIVPLSYRTDGGHTAIDLDLLPDDAAFIVFRKKTRLTSRTVPAKQVAELSQVNGPWSVAFEAGRGAPAGVEFDRLTPLQEDARPGVRYFSGVATYTTHFAAPARKAGKILIDLGAVGDVAEVRVNGLPAGIAWKPPYRLDITRAIRPGDNHLEVRVANLWQNRLIGDLQPGAETIAYASNQTFTADTPLRTSGLIGPVRILSQA
jgi:hypothetical protein